MEESQRTLLFRDRRPDESQSQSQPDSQISDSELPVRSIDGKQFNDDGSVVYKVIFDTHHGQVSDSAWLPEYDLDNCRDSIREFETARDPHFHPQTAATSTKAAEFSPFVAASTKGYHAVIFELWAREREKYNRAAIRGMDFETFRCHCLSILASVDKELYEALLCGNLQRRKYVSRDLRVALDRYQIGYKNVNGKRPAHYIFEFVNKLGYTPTVGQARDLLDQMERYADHWQYAWEIDRFDDVPDVGQQEYSQGYRKYLKGFDQAPRNVLMNFLRTSRKWL